MEPSSRSVDIHPLVITSVCDHYTRLSLGGSILPPNAPVIGLLFGTRDGVNTSLHDATEAVYQYSDSNIILNHESILKKKELWTAVYTTQELVGWYTVGTDVSPHHLQMHREMMAFSPDLLFLFMNSSIDHDAKHLPLSVYEMQSAGSNQAFVECTLKIESSEVEKIAIDEVLKYGHTDGKSSVEAQNASVLSSLKSLESRIDVLVTALQDMRSGKIPRDDDLLRHAAYICGKIPPSGHVSDHIQEKLNEDLEDTLAVSLLSSINSNLTMLEEVYTCYSVAHGERVPTPRIRG